MLLLLFNPQSLRWSVTFDGEDRTDYVKPWEQLRVENRVFEASGTATIPISVSDGSFTPEVEMEVHVFDRGQAVFAGFVRKVKHADRGWSTGPIEYTVVCQDYTTLLDDDVIETAYRSAAESDKSRINWLVNEFGTRGVIADDEVQALIAAMPVGTDDRAEQDFSGKTLREAIEQIAKITGGRYYVDLDRQLHYFAAETSTAPFALSDVATAEAEVASFTMPYPLGEAPTPSSGEAAITAVPYDGLTFDDDSVALVHEVLVVGAEPEAGSGGSQVKVWRQLASLPPIGSRRRTVVRDSSITTVAQANAVGDGVLAENGAASRTGSLYTRTPGLRAGMTVPITHIGHGWFDQVVYISSVTSYAIGPEVLEYHVQFGTRPVDDMAGTLAGRGSPATVAGQAHEAAQVSMAHLRTLQAAGANLLPDSSFESSVDAAWGIGTGWTRGFEVEDAYRGQLVARLVRSAASSGTFAPAVSIPVNRTDDYFISFWSFMRSISSGAGLLYLYQYDSAGGLLAQTLLATVDAAETEWKRHTFHFGPTEQIGRRAFHASTVRVKPLFFAFTSTLTWDVDGVQVERGTRPTAFAPMPEELYNVPGEVVIDEYGITIINGALVVKNPGGTVVIDGTSDMHKIVATGTLATGALSGQGQQGGEVNLSTGLPYRPASAWFLELSIWGAVPLPWYFMNWISIPEGNGVVLDGYWGSAEHYTGGGSDQTKLHGTLASSRAAGHATRTYRYFVYKEEAI